MANGLSWEPGTKFKSYVMTPNCEVIEEEVTRSWLFGWCYTSQYDFPVMGGDLWCTCLPVIRDMAAIRKSNGSQSDQIEYNSKLYTQFEKKRNAMNSGEI